MESKKVKEIKKALECCKENEDTNSLAYCHRCPFGGHVSCEQELYQKALTLINELESENERYKQSCGAIGQNSLTIINQLKDRIAELEEYIKGNEQGAKAFVNGWHKDLETELKQFAERLKDKLKDNVNGANVDYYAECAKFMSETLKEFIDAKNSEH